MLRLARSRGPGSGWEVVFGSGPALPCAPGSPGLLPFPCLLRLSPSPALLCLCLPFLAPSAVWGLAEPSGGVAACVQHLSEVGAFPAEVPECLFSPSPKRGCPGPCVRACVRALQPPDVRARPRLAERCV
ncbi:hypothetical protein HJG60_012295 [Phyllostomus discolor]|uniref:Uncharacterized protein n=1 Tax=Phyllostomus discolor TaxID=89673 RepID=A0A834DSG5_9CHIR|nr:hypothetical protein HJG60_012295 [Phyllostomus discolor]